MTYKRFSQNDALLLENIMRQRRDVRGNRFTQEPLNDDDLSRILNAALMAPSVGFSQPWRFVIIRDQETKAQVSKVFSAENEKAAELFEDERARTYQQLKLEGIQEAPVNVAVFYEASDQPVLGQTSMLEAGQYSTVCAIQNMWLMARALNIGLGWVSILDAKAIEELLNAAPHQSLVAYLCIGHVDTFYDKPELQTLGWAEFKTANEVIFEETLTASPPKKSP